MKKYILIILFLIFIFGQRVYAATSASQTITATLTRVSPTPPPGPGPGFNPAGAIVGGAIGGSAAGASALAFAPLLLAGLEPNSVICAASPIECIQCIQDFLQMAITDHFGCVQDFWGVIAKKKEKGQVYLVQNNSEILNGTYDLHALAIPEELQSAKRLKVNITMASQGYKEVYGEPELVFGIYKDINPANLSKKFETQQFLHHYLMKKYETPLKITLKNYNNGIQKLSGVIDLAQLKNINQPLQVVVRYTEGGFRKNLKKTNPKTLVYAYVIEFEKIR